jgi:hypothetical protein
MPVDPEMYADAEAPAAAEEPAAPEEQEAPEDTESDSGSTAELPKSILGGKTFKPGDEVVLRVVQLTENSVIVEYASEPESSGESPQREQYRGGMAAMME